MADFFYAIDQVSHVRIVERALKVTTIRIHAEDLPGMTRMDANFQR